MNLSKIIKLSALSLALAGSTLSYAHAGSVNVVMNGDPMLRGWFHDVGKAYEKLHPDIKVNFHVIAGTEDNYYTKLALMMKTSTKLDVIFEDSFMLRGDVDAGLLASLPGAKSWGAWDQFYPNLRQAMTLDGKIYAYPLSTDSRGLFYNTAILKKSGVSVPWHPKTWEDVIDAARAVHNKYPSITPITMNVAANGEATSMQTAEMLLYGTQDRLLKDGKWNVSSKGLLDTFKFINTVFSEHLGPRLGTAMNSQYGNILQKTLAPEQKVGIILDGAWLGGNWSANYPQVLKNYKLTPMPTQFGQKPGHVTMSGGWTLAMSAKSTNRQQALDFMHFALNKKNMLSYATLANNLATRKDVAAMKAYPPLLKQPGSFLQFAHFRPANESYPVVSTYLQSAVESVVTAEKTPQQAMQQFAASVERTLGKDKIVKTYPHT